MGFRHKFIKGPNALIQVGRSKLKRLLGLAPCVHEDNDVVEGASVAPGEKDALRVASPLPFPEHIICLIIDQVRLDKERALAAAMADTNDLHLTQKSIDYAFRFDGDLWNLSLVSLLWTRLVRRALGQKLFLILDGNRKPKKPLDSENPLYGPWTTHVEILEMPHTSFPNNDYVETFWSVARCKVERLENVQSFTINTCIFAYVEYRLLQLLPCFKNMHELTLINTGLVFYGFGFFKMLASVTAQLPNLRRLSFRRYIGEGCRPYTTEATRDPFPNQLRALASALYSSSRCSFIAKFVSLDREDGQWVPRTLKASHLCRSCPEDCSYNDPLRSFVGVQYLHIVKPSITPLPLCCAEKLVRNFTNTKVVRLECTNFAVFPAQETLDALPAVLEELFMDVKPIPSSEEIEAFDKRLSRFCNSRTSTFRRVALSLGYSNQRVCHPTLFPSTTAALSAVDEGLVVSHGEETPPDVPYEWNIGFDRYPCLWCA